MNDTKTVFVIDTFNIYNHEQVIKARRIFQMNQRWFAIYETELVWGVPQLGFLDDEYRSYYYYETFEEADNYVTNLRKLEGLSL